MRIAVVGAGAIGGVIAAAAADAGHDVSLRVRSPFERLVIERDGRETTVPVAVSVEPAGPPAELVFLAVKATDTASAGAHLAAVCGPTTTTVIVQNGVGQADRARPHLPAGAGPVVPALTYVAAEQLAPGRIRHLHGSLLMVPGEHAALVEAAIAPKLRARGTDDFLTESWRKLFANLLGNPITAITMRHMDVMRSPGMEDLARSVLLEAVAVARAEGAQLTDDDVGAVLDGVSRFGSETASSMLYDRRAGRPLEHEYLTGEVVRRGAADGILVPVNAALLALLVAVDPAGGGGRAASA